MRAVLILAATAAALSACASQDGPISGYNAEQAQLERECAARGGILAPTGAQTGRPQTENVCKITGGPSNHVPHG